MEIGIKIAGKYQIVGDLGAGGMGRAMLARSEGGALVVLKTTLSGNRDDDERLRDEARVGMRLLHPHVVETLDLVEERGHPVLVTAYVSGASMFDLRRSGALPPAVVCRIGRQIAEALDAVHFAVDEDARHLHMLHRDVTPGNIMLGHDGRARLIDLGIVQSVESRAQRTETGNVRGTVRYLAPELFAGHRHSIATDIWALGVVLWEALLGREAVQGSTAAAVGAICTGNVMVLGANERVDGRVQRAVARLLAKDPADRPARARDAAAIFAMLEKELAGHADLEQQMKELVSARVGPPEVDDAAHQSEILSRAKSMFGPDKLRTTDMAQVEELMLDVVVGVPNIAPAAPAFLPRIATPPQAAHEGLQDYVRMLASLERRQK